MVSIIVPVFNAEKYLEKCIESIVFQSYGDIEVLLVDDGSTDNSSKICEFYRLKDCRIKVFHQQNKGVSAARNCGLRNASGEYIMFVDSDDYLEADAVEKVVHANENVNSEVVIFNYYKVGGIRKEKCDSVTTGLKTKEQFIDECFQNLNTVYYYKIYNKLYKRKVILDNKIFFPEDKSIGEDLRFNLDYFSVCLSFFMINNYLYNYRIDNNQSIMHSIIDVSIEESLEEVKDVISYLKSNTCDFSRCYQGADKYVLDKVNGTVSLYARLKRKADKELDRFLRLLKAIHNVRDFSSVKYSFFMRSAWKWENSRILMLRYHLIKVRYHLIMKIKGKKL